MTMKVRHSSALTIAQAYLSSVGIGVLVYGVLVYYAIAIATHCRDLVTSLVSPEPEREVVL